MAGRHKSAERLYLEQMVTPEQLRTAYHLEGLRYTASSFGVTPWLLLRVIDAWDIPRLGNTSIAPNARIRMCATISIIRRRSVGVITRELQASLKKPMPEYYPFITEPQNEHHLVKLVDEIVPKGLPEGHRQDICQDLLVAVLDHQVEVSELKEAVPEFIKRAYKFFPTKYRNLSLDTPFQGEDGGRTLAEVISEDNIIQHW